MALIERCVACEQRRLIMAAWVSFNVLRSTREEILADFSAYYLDGVYWFNKEHWLMASASHDERELGQGVPLIQLQRADERS